MAAQIVRAEDQLIEHIAFVPRALVVRDCAGDGVGKAHKLLRLAAAAHEDDAG